MIDYLIMGVIVVFLALILLIGMKVDDSEKHFFDLSNSKAMRGFWCLIIILVHVPAAYQNRIQDMIGSFAYIGVTFFFMTSGYGLTLSADKHPEAICYYWRNRLPKLLIPNWVVNLCFALISFLIFSDGTGLAGVAGISGWVRWLLGCYLIFWLSCRLPKGKKRQIFTAAAVTVGSILFYILKTTGIVTSATWTTECFGFIWGTFLAATVSGFIAFFKESWLKKWMLSLILALVLGVAYLKFKPVIFFGDYLLKIFLGIAITLFILIANVKFCLGNKLSLFLGEISFEIYLIHGKMFLVISQAMPQLSSGMFILLSMVATVVLAWILHILSGYILKMIYSIDFFHK